MVTFKWSDEYALGIEEIDQQHRALIEKINAFDVSAHGESREHATRKLLDDLTDYVYDHFLLEECLMAKGRCSAELVARHRVEHAHFRSVLRDVRNDFEGGRTTVTASLIEYLVHWLLHHIVVVDREMAGELNAAAPLFGVQATGVLVQHVTDHLTDSERHLLAELRRAYAEVEARVSERTRGLMEKIRTLEMALREKSALVEQLSQGHLACQCREHEGIPGLLPGVSAFLR